MNDIEKAIKWMQFLIELQLNATRAMIHCNGRKKLGKSYLREMGQKIANYKLAISALEKQIPKNVDFTELNYSKLPVAKCPSCKSKDIQNDYCPDCGQKLDWEDSQ